MNLEDSGDDYYICEDCGRRNYPEVGMSQCDCRSSKMYGNSYDSGECTAAPGVGGGSSCNCSGCRGGYEVAATPAHDPIKAYWEMDTSTMRAHPPRTYDERTVRVSYLFIKHQTEKAILFAMQDSNGVYQQWVPKAVITAMSEDTIMVKENFYRRNMQ